MYSSSCFSALIKPPPFFGQWCAGVYVSHRLERTSGEDYFRNNRMNLTRTVTQNRGKDKISLAALPGQEV